MNKIFPKGVGGSYFQIYANSELFKSANEYSIEECDVYEYLFHLLKKYYNEEESSKFREKEDGVGFQWWSIPNVYTYENMRCMVKEIEKIVDSLESDKENKSAEIYFYNEFCKVIENLMVTNPKFNFITFEGP